jgi:hypothetical protein
MFMRAIPAAATIAALFLFAAPAMAQTFMSEDELLAAIPGSIIDSTSKDGTRWAQAYSKYGGGKKSGSINVNFGGAKSKSKWSVKNGQWCEDWGSGSACWQVERVSEKELRMYENGKPRPNLWVMR